MSELRVLCIGDPHIRDEDVKRIDKMISEIFRVANELKPDLIVNLGDTLHDHEKMKIKVRSKAVRFIQDLSKIAPTHVLIGNHDRTNNQDFLTDDHPFTGMENTDRLQIHSQVKIVEVNGFSLLFLPYVFKGLLHKAIQTVLPSEEVPEKIDLAFLHAEIQGCKMESGIISNDGDKWPSNFPLGISGHIHTYGKVGSNFIFPGTSIQHRFGDDPDRCISLFTFQKDEISENFERVNRIGFQEERIRLKVPQLLSYRMTPTNFMKFIPPAEKAKIRIKIVGTRDQLDSISSVKIDEFREKGIQVVEEVLVPESENEIEIEKGFLELFQEKLSPAEKRFIDSLEEME